MSSVRRTPAQTPSGDYLLFLRSSQANNGTRTTPHAVKTPNRDATPISGSPASRDNAQKANVNARDPPVSTAALIALDMAAG